MQLAPLAAVVSRVRKLGSGSLEHLKPVVVNGLFLGIHLNQVERLVIVTVTLDLRPIPSEDTDDVLSFVSRNALLVPGPSELRLVLSVLTLPEETHIGGVEARLIHVAAVPVVLDEVVKL